MTANTPSPQLPAAIRDQLERLYSQLSGSSAAIYMWRELMTEQDRWRLRNEVDKEPYNPQFDDVHGENLPSDDEEMKGGLAGRTLHRCFYRWGAIGMWMKLKGLPQPLAIIALAYERGLSEAARRRLSDALGLKPPAKPPSKLPVWDREEKTLRLGRTRIRTIASLNRATNIVLILDRFQKKGWQKVASPLEGSKLQDAVYSLNKGLKKLRFHVCDNGASIAWEISRSSSQRRVHSDRSG
jgi:hypothetical protein